MMEKGTDDIKDLDGAKRCLLDLDGDGSTRWGALVRLHEAARNLPSYKIKTVALLAARACANDPNSTIRQEAATMLGALGSRRDLYAIKVLLKDKEMLVRSEAVLALGQIGNKSDRKLLWNIIDTDPDWIVRGDAIWSIADHATDEDTTRLRSLLEQFKDDPLTSSDIHGSLLMLDQKDSLEPFLNRLDSDADFLLCRILNQLCELWKSKEWLRYKKGTVLDALSRYQEQIHRYRSSASSEEKLLDLMNS